MSKISFVAQIIPDKFRLFEAESDASWEEVLPQALQACLGPTAREELNLENYRVLIAYQLTHRNASPRSVAMDAVTPLSTQGFSIRDLKLKNGFFLIFVKLPISTTKLELLALRKRIALLDKQDEYLMGRTDEQQNIFPEIDITSHLSAENENRVSRQQAIIFSDDSKWRIKLHNDARTSVFLNNERMEHGQDYDIKEDTVINLGSDPENPLLRIMTRLIPE